LTSNAPSSGALDIQLCSPSIISHNITSIALNHHTDTDIPLLKTLKILKILKTGVSFPDDSFGQGTADTPPEKLMGKPWMFVVRDVLQHTSTLEEGVESVQVGENKSSISILSLLSRGFKG